MVKLATPISRLFEAEQQAKRIIEFSDCLEGRDHSFDSDLSGQEAFHCDIELIKPWTLQDREYVQRILEQKKEMQLLSFHMASAYSDPVLRDFKFYPGTGAYTADDLQGFAKSNVNFLRGLTTSRDVTIAVENNNFYPTGAYTHVTDPDFITRIVSDNSINFLLDVSHAMISAHNRKETLEQYLGGLPLSYLVQMHLSCHRVDDKGLAYDAHDAPDQSMWELAKNLINRFACQYVTVEYYRDTDGLIDSLTIGRKIFKRG